MVRPNPRRRNNQRASSMAGDVAFAGWRASCGNGFRMSKDSLRRQCERLRYRRHRSGSNRRTSGRTSSGALHRPLCCALSVRLSLKAICAAIAESGRQPSSKAWKNSAYPIPPMPGHSSEPCIRRRVFISSTRPSANERGMHTSERSYLVHETVGEHLCDPVTDALMKLLFVTHDLEYQRPHAESRFMRKGERRKGSATLVVDLEGARRGLPLW